MPTKKEIIDDSVTNLATAHGFVNGFFPGHLRDIMLWLWSSGKITSCWQVARHGWVGGMWRWKTTGKLAGMTKSLILRTLWPIGVDSSTRPFLSTSRKCSRSAISSVGPQDYWYWTTPIAAGPTT